MTPTRLTTTRLRQLADELPDRYTVPLLHLSRARVLTGGQLDRLLQQPDITPRTAERARQRAITHLRRLGLVSTLNRRIGGVRAGSTGYVHVLSPAGHKLAAILTGTQIPGSMRRFRAPGLMAMAHALDIADIYVQLTETSHRSGGFTVAAFVTEPATWWRQHGVTLRPDAYVLLAADTHKDCWWLEIDRATESLPRLRDKLHDYRDHATSGGTGPHGARPNVLFTTPDQHRADTIRTTIDATGGGIGESVTVTTHDRAAHVMITELDKP